MTIVSFFVTPAQAAPTPDSPGRDGEAVSRLDSGVSEAVWNALTVLDQSGSMLFPNLYGGKTLGSADDPDHLNVFLTSLDVSAERAIQTLTGLGGSQISFRRSDTTWTALLEQTARLHADLSSLIEQGFAVLGAGINGNMRPFFIVSPDIPAGQKAQLQGRYGNQLEFMVDGQAVSYASGRADDSAPWYGGAFMSNGNDEGCTAGFAVRWAANGNNYMLTAGHCFLLAANVYNGIAQPIGIGGYNTNLYGSVTNRTFGNGGLDAELIATNGGSRIWSGSTTTSSSIPVNAIATTYNIGQPVCAGGAYEGESCGNSVNAINICRVVQKIQSCGLDYVTSSNAQAVGSGDSGGPVYAAVGGTTYAFGTISISAGEANCTNWSSYQTRRCGRNWYFTELDQVASQWNLVLDN